MKALRVLITNTTLAGRTGTEIVTRDLALGLLKAGHRPSVYSPKLGDVAREIASAGVPVVSDLARLSEAPEIIHGHHHVETVRALLRFPGAPGVFVCHDRLSPTDVPPSFPRLRRYVAVDENCRERLTVDYGIPKERVRVIYNGIDLRRFPARRRPLPKSPGRALVFSNYAGPATHWEPIRDACAALNLPLDVIGSGSGKTCAAPENVLGGYDLVFAKARCALEAMAAGAAVILCDAQGLGPLVTGGAVSRLRPWNFGMRLLDGPLEPGRIIEEIRKYDADDAAAASRLLRAQADLSLCLDQYLELYQEAMDESAGVDPGAEDELNGYLFSLLGRIGALEAKGPSPDSMGEMGEAECAGLSLSATEVPGAVKAGEAFSVRVELENKSRRRVGAFFPYPVQFSYRWLSPAGDVIVREGERTALRPALSPGEKKDYFVRVTAPGNGGGYRLRLTLVQEWVRWLDALPYPVQAERDVVVERGRGAP